MRKPLGLFVAVIVVASLAMPMGLALAAPVAQIGSHVGSLGAVTNQFSGTSYRSLNWAGYAATGANGSVKKVTGSWVEPSVTCTSVTSIAAFWVGIDGFSSNTVEQTGTIIECVGGVAYHYSWWEMYPLNSVQLVGTVSAGDHILASVTHSSGSTFKIVFKDLTAATGFSTSQSQTGTSRSSAECIAEAPAGASTTSGLYPLADFGKVHFSNCAAKIGGVTSGIGGFSTVSSITMVSYPSGSHNLATVSALTSNKAFTVTWHHST